MREHERSVYTFLDLIGELGGVSDLITFFLGIFIYPFSEHFFIMKFLRKMYIVRSKSLNIFKTAVGKPLKKDKKKPKFKNINQ